MRYSVKGIIGQATKVTSVIIIFFSTKCYFNELFFFWKSGFVLYKLVNKTRTIVTKKIKLKEKMNKKV